MPNEQTGIWGFIWGFDGGRGLTGLKLQRLVVRSARGGRGAIAGRAARTGQTRLGKANFDEWRAREAWRKGGAKPGEMYIPAGGGNCRGVRLKRGGRSVSTDVGAAAPALPWAASGPQRRFVPVVLPAGRELPARGAHDGDSATAIAGEGRQVTGHEGLPACGAEDQRVQVNLSPGASSLRGGLPHGTRA